MENDIVKVLKQCGGYMASRRGVYIYDEELKEVHYIPKEKIDTPEEDISWVVVHKERDHRRLKIDIPEKDEPKYVTFSENEEDFLDDLLATLQYAGGSFDTKRYHYELDMRARLMLRMDKRLYYSPHAGPEDWEILGAFEIL